MSLGSGRGSMFWLVTKSVASQCRVVLHNVLAYRSSTGTSSKRKTNGDQLGSNRDYRGCLYGSVYHRLFCHDHLALAQQSGSESTDQWPFATSWARKLGRYWNVSSFTCSTTRGTAAFTYTPVASTKSVRRRGAYQHELRRMMSWGWWHDESAD